MRYLIWLVVLALPFHFTGCGEFRKQFGRQPGHTLVTFKLGDGDHNPASVIYPLYGGVLVIMRTDQSNAFGTTVFIADETKPVQIAVPNGVYHAGMIGWEGNASPPCTPGSTCKWAEGQSKCGIAYNDNTFALTGQSLTIPITMSAAVCQTGYNGSNSTPFSDVTYNPVGDPAFPSLSFLTSHAPYNAGSHYLGVWLNTYDIAQGVKTRKNHFKLVCVPISSGSATSNLRLPVGKSNNDDLFSYTLTFHGSADTTCATPTDTAEFDKGFIYPPTSGTFTTSSISYGSNINTITVN